MPPIAPRTEVEIELDGRIREAKFLANRSEFLAGDDARATELVEALRRKLNGALNAIPQRREAIIAACEAIERHAKEHKP